MRQIVHELISDHEAICLFSAGGIAQVYLGFSSGTADVGKPYRVLSPATSPHPKVRRPHAEEY